MKRIILIMSISLSFFSVYGQSLMTIGQVYDFNVNDEFQYTTYNQPPNAVRIKIIGKYYSTNSDTVFYIEHYNNYTSTVDNNPSPHLVYTVSIGTDTVFYTNLGDTIQFFGTNDSCRKFDDSISYPSKFCGRKTYSFDSCISYCFEPVCDGRSYTLGLGQTIIGHSDDGNMVYYDNELFYYKKDTMTCGVADTTALSIRQIKNQLSHFSIFPNPANNSIRLDVGKMENVKNTTCQIYDETGRLVKTVSIQSKQQNIDVSGLAKGIYQILLRNNTNNIASGRFVKE